MKEETKRAKLAALFGLEEHVPTKPEPTQVRLQEDASREAEAVAAFIARPQTFKQVECKQCGNVFAVDRANVAFCKDECREHWLASIGIVWDPRKPPEQRWDYKEPLTVPPTALVVANLATEMLIAKGVSEPEPVAEAVGQNLHMLPEPVVSDQEPPPIVYNL